jgi:hypothetical protein
MLRVPFEVHMHESWTTLMGYPSLSNFLDHTSTSLLFLWSEEKGLELWWLTPIFQQYFSYILAVSFIGEGNFYSYEVRSIVIDQSRNKSDLEIWSIVIEQSRNKSDVEVWSFVIDQSRNKGDVELWSFVIDQSRNTSDVEVWSIVIEQSRNKSDFEVWSIVINQTKEAL